MDFFKDLANKATKSIQKQVIYFPKILFRLYEENTEVSFDNTYSRWADVILLKGGVLVVEENDILYSSHSIGHNTGRNTRKREITFEQLPELIRQSKDERAAHYIGMNKGNWQEYVKEESDEVAPSRYSTMSFGGLEWYILDQFSDNSLLLLSKYGIDSRPWNEKEIVIDWEKSTLCDWLNKDFLNKYFSKSEQRSLVSFDDHTKVTILDVDQFIKYLQDDSAATAKPSKEALQKGVWTYPYSPTRPDAAKYVGNGLVWLKSNYSGTTKGFETWIQCVNWDGGTCMHSCNNDKPLVRPVIRVLL